MNETLIETQETTNLKDNHLYQNAVTKKIYGPTNLKLLEEAAKVMGIEDKIVAGFRQWQEIGRKVKKGQTGTNIYIVLDAIEKTENGKEINKKVSKALTVFFESQTEKY